MKGIFRNDTISAHVAVSACLCTLPEGDMAGVAGRWMLADNCAGLQRSTGLTMQGERATERDPQKEPRREERVASRGIVMS